MKICIACAARFDVLTWQCPACLFSPGFIENYPAFSPKLAYENEGFKADLFVKLAALEEKNFWFRARNRLIIWALKQYFPKINDFFEVGCGTGFILAGLAQAFPNLTLYGSEIFSTSTHD